MNGTKQLIDSLFKGNEDAFIEHFVKSCLFLPKKVVEKRANEILTDISNNIKVSVRFGKKYLSEFEAEPKRNALRKKSKSEIKKIAEKETLLNPITAKLNIKNTFFITFPFFYYLFFNFL